MKCNNAEQIGNKTGKSAEAKLAAPNNHHTTKSIAKTI